MKTRISFRWIPRILVPKSKFLQYVKIGGPWQNVRYLYIGALQIKIRRFSK